MSMKPLDLTGYRSGDLEFIRPAGRTPRGAILWECICHRCGQACQIIGNRVNAPRPPVDCGCRKRERDADLSGKTFGALEVLERRGSYKAGDKLYLCRCTLCGREKLFPACTIRANPKSCGCAQYENARMAEQSKLGIAAKFREVGGVRPADMVAAVSHKATVRSKTGVRGVCPEPGSPGTYRYYITVAGETVVKSGFRSIEEARKARERTREELLKKYGIEDKEG